MNVTRREILTALLGPAVAAACRRDRAPALAFEGVIAGADDRLGHLVRSGFRPAPQAVSRAAVVIVGGGVAGLSAAWRLARAGVGDYRVLELDARPGGTARGGENDVSPFPWGAHYLPCPLPHARAVELLLVEMGVAERGPDGRLAFDEAQLCRAPQERLFVADRWYEGLYPRAGATARDLDELRRFRVEVERLSALRDARGRRAFAVPMEHGSDDAELAALDRLSMADWMDARGLRGERIRWYAEYGCRDDYGATLEGTSAWAGLHYHASRTERGGHDDLLTAADGSCDPAAPPPRCELDVRRLAAPLAGGGTLPPHPPSRASLQVGGVITWPEGNARIVAHLARGAGARLETGRVVTEVELLPRGVAVTAFDPATLRCERVVADHVVLAVPRVAAARILRHPRLAEEARAFHAGPWLVANLTLRAQPRSRGFPQAWDNVLYGSGSLGYVVATHQSDRHGGGPAASVWTWYLSLTREDVAEAHRWLSGLSWREAAEVVIGDLRRAHPDIASCVSRLDVWRWGHAMIRPRPGFVFGPERRRAREPLGDVHFAHADLSGLPLFEEAQHHGIRAAEEILGRRGVAFESLL